MCGLHLQLVQLVGRFWVCFLSHTTPGFQSWFYFHLCLWVVHWGLLLRLPWRTWVCPSGGQVWRWCSCLGRRGSGSTRSSGELAARAAGNIVQPAGASTLQCSCLESPLPDRDAWQATVYQVTKSWTRPKRSCAHRHTTFLPAAALPQLCPRAECKGGTATWVAGPLAAPNMQGHGLPPRQELWLIRVFFPASYSW